MPELLAKKVTKARGPMSEATKEKLRATAHARHAAKLLDPNYKPKEKKQRKRKIGHLTEDFGSLAKFWKSGPKAEKKVKKKRVRLSKDMDDFSSLGNLFKEAKAVKVKKERKKKIGHLIDDFGSLANFWKAGPKVKSKKMKPIKFEESDTAS